MRLKLLYVIQILYTIEVRYLYGHLRALKQERACAECGEWEAAPKWEVTTVCSDRVVRVDALWEVGRRPVIGV